jgi:hypothetical protein
MKQLKELSGKELFDFIVANKKLITDSKKSAIKYTDAFSFSKSFVNRDGELCEKGIANSPVAEDLNKLKISVVINTTNFLDSHDDVHIPGLWKKSLSENKFLYLLQEHGMCFENVIADGDSVKAYTKKMSWKELGEDMEGVSEALIFDCVITKQRNEFMFNQYKNGYVKNHSVGMRYVTLMFCINDEDYKEEFANWNKYFPEIANKEKAEEEGYFFAVTEAKVVEGSAVVIGSNTATPTLDNNIKSLHTETEPVITTQQQPPQFDIMKAIRETRFI